MAVGDVKRVHALECPGQAQDVGAIVNHPQAVADAVGVGNVVFRRRRANPLRDLANLGIGAVDREHEPRLGVECVHVACPVLFLLGHCRLVAADTAAFVGRDRSRRDDAGLLVALARHAIDIVSRTRIALQHARVQHLAKRAAGAFVDVRPVRIGLRREIDLGPGHVEETPRLAGRMRARRFWAQDIVRR